MKDHYSFVHNLSNCEKKIEKIQACMDSNSDDLYNTSAVILNTELSSQVGAGHIVSL